MYLPSDNPASLVAWFRKGVGVTAAGGFASAWADQSGNGRNLLQATGTNQPAYDSGSGVLTFDGSDNFMKCAGFTLNQPEQVSMLFSLVSWAAGDYVFDGNAVNSMTLFEFTSTPSIYLYAGNLVAQNTGLTIGQFDAVTAFFNGAGSSLKINSNAATTGDAGAINGGGFTLAAAGTGIGVVHANIAVKEIIIRNVNDATIRAADQAYLLALQNDVTPVAAFTGVPTSGSVPLSVTFTDQSTNSPNTWLWDFGDGNTSPLQNPVHNYLVAGTYTVTLTASNYAGSDQEIKTSYITVSGSGPAVVTRSSGVRKAKSGKFTVRLADIQSRESTAEFLKSQLTRRAPDSAFEDAVQSDAAARKKRKEQRAREQREAKMRADAAKAQMARTEAQATEIRTEVETLFKSNQRRKNIRTLMSLAAMVV